MVAREICGMLLMILAAAGSSVCMALCSLVPLWHIPYYRLSGTAELVMAAGLAIAIVVKGELFRLRAHEWKWVFLRGAFGSASALLAWAAVAEGAPLGDASALGSVNVVVAALLGLLLLGEPLSSLHILALIFSLAGAVLVSKPEAIFGTTNAVGNPAWFGHALALGSGLSSGGLFIASRKSQGISPLVMTFSVLFQEGLSCWFISWIGLVEDGPFEQLLMNPLVGVAWFWGLLMLMATCVCAISLGSQMCPAVASSTIFTSVSMSLGYVAQSVIHHQQPEVLTGAGALLMLMAVALIAAARRWQSGPVSAREFEDLLLSEEEDEAAEDDLIADSQVESLVSFIAAEFSGLRYASKSVRRRRAFFEAAESLSTTLA